MYAEIDESISVVTIAGEVIKQMTAILRSKHLDYVKFHIDFTKKILPDAKTGKKALVLQETEDDTYGRYIAEG